MSTFDADMSPLPQNAATSRRVTRALLRRMMRPARVAAVETLSSRFRLIDLEGEGLRSVSQALKKSSIGSSGVKSKACWSPGKTGLD
ncbi:hypothetical protein KUA08_15490 [Komagataeibacter melomenusus]|uniref:hypothetical protein n=1 Tax=Komagataeibacter melomenusus TaxID=2766578 RepID=UPI0016526897|nr:hypothetical protein [Komagataeibacter melomenusus]MBV1831988.1 hypothetical protein [Komagataeibacter melomenusus]